MSVLIKGMNMPKACVMCWLSPICPTWVKEVSRYKGYDNRLPNCPLIEVPPHGRLIDADALQQSIGSYNPVKYTYEYGDVITVADIDNAPSIIEAEGGS